MVQLAGSQLAVQFVAGGGHVVELLVQAQFSDAAVVVVDSAAAAAVVVVVTGFPAG